jgi:AraC-like DNA-binding protein
MTPQVGAGLAEPWRGRRLEVVEIRSEMVSALPAGPLRPFVGRYMGYLLTGYEPGVHRGLPSQHMTFIASIGPPIEVVAQTDPSQAPASYGCVVGGLQATSARIEHLGHQEGVAIELTPLGSRNLFGMPASALWSTSIELAELEPSVGRELWERLQGTSGWPERFAVCDDVLGRAVAADRAVAPELTLAWRSIVGSGGATTVGEIASEVGWSRQHLTRRFTDEFGLGPKLAARVVRLHRETRVLRLAPSTMSLAEVAAVCGYYDQSHLDRDFAELVGCPPTQWLAEELPSVQDGGAAELSH